MIVKGKEVLIDTNLLVYSSNTLSPKYRESIEFRNSAIKGEFKPVIAHQNILEMFRVLTHPKYNNPFSIEEVLQQGNNFEKLCRIIYPGSETLEIAKRLCEKYKTSSNLVFDVYLVATMISNDIKIIATDNVKDLSTFKEIEVYNPFSFQYQ